MIYITSDLHLNHAKIIEYYDRPYKDVKKMNAALINNINARVKENDTLYHVGDFMFKGGWEGGTRPASYFENKIKGKLIHILGNHDRNNTIKNSIVYAELEFANKRWVMQHIPPYTEGQLRIFPKEMPTIYLVGHVHAAWKHKWIGNTLLINVGVDVWNFYPRSTNELAGYAEQITKEKQNAK
jgi:calcineurin-like phosphoesterase family protein